MKSSTPKGPTRAGRPIDQDKQKHILQVAHRLLLQGGVHAVNMEAVARLAGVSKATVYARYASRDALIRAAVHAQSGEFIAPFERPPVQAHDLRAALLRFATEILWFLSRPETHAFLRVMGEAPEPLLGLRDGIFQSGPQSTLEGLAQWLRAAALTGLIDCPHPQRSAEALLGMLMGMDLIRGAFGQPIQCDHSELATRVQFVIDLFLRAHKSAKSPEKLF
ncbi:MAG: TetR/AcrR family transcriptional regulator [Gammaproteobacteria bacterium]